MRLQFHSKQVQLILLSIWLKGKFPLFVLLHMHKFNENEVKMVTCTLLKLRVIKMSSKGKETLSHRMAKP